MENPKTKMILAVNLNVTAFHLQQLSEFRTPKIWIHPESRHSFARFTKLVKFTSHYFG